MNETDEDDEPFITTKLDRYEQAKIQVHYLPARRDPADHIAHTNSTLMGRLLRAVDWSAEQATASELTQKLSNSLAANPAISSLGRQLAVTWNRLHTGTYFTTPSVTFTGSDIDALLRYLNIAFDTAPGGGPVDWTRLSDGQQSLLYLTVVLALHDLGTQVLARKRPDRRPGETPPGRLHAHRAGRTREQPLAPLHRPGPGVPARVLPAP